jgi:hypothetical protein
MLLSYDSIATFAQMDSAAYSVAVEVMILEVVICWYTNDHQSSLNGGD